MDKIKIGKELIYPELSYQLISIAFKIYNQLGCGYQEKYYQRAYAIELDKEKIKYQSERESSKNIL